VSVYLGRLDGAGDLSEEERARQIAIAERLLVYFAAPPYNSALLTRSAWQAIAQAPPTVVINLRQSNRLAMEVSNLGEIELPTAVARPVGDDLPD